MIRHVTVILIPQVSTDRNIIRKHQELQVGCPLKTADCSYCLLETGPEQASFTHPGYRVELKQLSSTLCQQKDEAVTSHVTTGSCKVYHIQFCRKDPSTMISSFTDCSACHLRQLSKLSFATTLLEMTGKNSWVPPSIYDKCTG